MYWAGHMLGLSFCSLLEGWDNANKEQEKAKQEFDKAKQECDKEVKFLSELSEAHIGVYQKIVDDLLHAHAQRKPLPNTLQTYVVVLRHSASWDTVQKQLTELSDPSFFVNEWKVRWENVISNLNIHQQKIYECGDLLMDLPRDDPKRASCRKALDDEKKSLRKVLKEAHHRLLLDINDPLLKNRQEPAAILEHLRMFWPHLSLVSEWTEVSLNYDGLNVQIQMPVLLKNKVTALLADPATTGIYLVKAEEPDPEKMDRDPLRKKDRPISNIPEIFTLNAYKLGPYFAPLPPNASLSYKLLHRQSYEFADKIYQIVVYALAAVNRSLAE